MTLPGECRTWRISQRRSAEIKCSLCEQWARSCLKSAKPTWPWFQDMFQIVFEPSACSSLLLRSSFSFAGMNMQVYDGLCPCQWCSVFPWFMWWSSLIYCKQKTNCFDVSLKPRRPHQQIVASGSSALCDSACFLLVLGCEPPDPPAHTICVISESSGKVPKNLGTK